MKLEDQIREGQIMQDDNRHPNKIFRGIFIDGNFYLYKLVESDIRFREDTFNDDKLVLVFADITNRDRSTKIPPTTVDARGRS